MNIQSVPTPTRKDSLQKKLQAIIHEYTSGDEALAAEYEGQLDKLMGLLPEEIDSQLLITRRCKKPLEAYVEEKTKEGLTEIIELKERICAEVTLVMYSDYISDSILRIYDYLNANPEIIKWGIGALSHWDDNLETDWASSFYNFWRKKVEKRSDAIFREKIVARLPSMHADKYRSKDKCPYKWASMSDQEIASVLVGLKKRHDPAKNRWGIGSTSDWTSDKGEEWGKSFKEYWRLKVETGSVENFKQRILVHLPSEWQNNFYFRTRCPYEWGEMRPQQIANAIRGLSRHADPATQEWGLGSVGNWLGEEGQPWGMSFFSYWWAKHNRNGVELFEDTVLPHLPQGWRENFKHKEYKKRDERSYQEIADLIAQLIQYNSFEGKRWGLGNMTKLRDEEGNKEGWNIYMYWRNNVERGTDEQFRKRILPLMPAALTKNYKMNAYNIDFHEETDETNGRVESANTMDALYEILCETKSRKAFDKLVMLIQDELKTDDYKNIIEKCIHGHVEASGPLISYCRKHVAHTKLYNSTRVRYYQDGRVQEDKNVALVADTHALDDFEYYLQLIEQKEFSEAAIQELTELITGRNCTLESIIADEKLDINLRSVAREVHTSIKQR